MNTMKKLFALMLALALVLSLAVPAMAEGTTPATYTITINGSTSASASSAAGHIYEAYQILSGTVDPETAEQGGDLVVKLADVDWGHNVNKDTLLAALKADTTFGEGASNLFSSVETADDFVNVVGANTFTTGMVDKLAHILNSHIINAPMDISEETAPPYFLDVPAGYYLIKDQDGSLEEDAEGNPLLDKDYTDIILAVSKTVTINHKGSVPTVTKTVSERGDTYYEVIDAAMKTDFYFKLVGTLPSDFEKYEHYFYEFLDTPSAGIDFVSVESVYAVYNNGSTVDLTPSNAPNYYDAENRTITITFDDLKHDNNAHNFTPGNQIVVIYKARLNENAVVSATGNDNTVHLEYSNDPQTNGTGQTSDDNAKVYTFGIKVHKYDGADPTKVMEDVTFLLYRTSRDAGSSTIPEYAIVNAAGKITGWTTYDHDDELPEGAAAATVLSTNEAGEFVVQGLDSGKKYYLKELQTHEGYNTIEEPIELQLTPITDENGNPTGLNVTPSNYYNATPNSYTEGEEGTVNIIGVTLKIPNTQGIQLPSTGGIGTTVFYIAGAILVLGAIVLLVTKKRMN